MRNGVLAIVVCAAALLVLPASAAAAAKPVVGLGDQKAQMFDDPRMAWLGVKHARLVVPWFIATKSAAIDEQRHVTAWLEAARRDGVEPLVAFGHGFVGWTRIYLPKPDEYRRAIRAFRKRWPWVKTVIPWNEANHCSQPTCRKPEAAARFFDIVKNECRGCKVVATAVIDQPNMVPWLRRFERAAQAKVTVLGLHNYLDVNRLRSRGTQRLLKAFKGEVWITEAGGVVYRRKFKSKVADFPENATHAGKVIRYTLDLATKLSSRVQRVYLYHWNVDRPQPTWDSGLIDWAGVARPGFSALARFMGRDPLRAPKIVPLPPSSSPSTPGATNPPPPSPSGSPPPSSGGGSGGSQPPPPSEEPDPGCSITVICPVLGGLG
jgi:Glycosyl hydrolase catalytic core